MPYRPQGGTTASKHQQNSHNFQISCHTGRIGRVELDANACSSRVQNRLGPWREVFSSGPRLTLDTPTRRPGSSGASATRRNRAKGRFCQRRGPRHRAGGHSQQSARIRVRPRRLLDLCLWIPDLEPGLFLHRRSPRPRTWVAPEILSWLDDQLSWVPRPSGSDDGAGSGRVLRRHGLPAAADGVDDVLMALIKREMPFVSSGMSARWMPLRTGQAPLHAIGFPINRSAPSYVPHLTEEQVVTSLATASGTAGSMAEYLLNTITHLQANGIHDRALWRLQDLVATRLEESPLKESALEESPPA